MVQSLVAWLQQYSVEIAILSGLSVLLLLVTILATPWLVAQLPADYFSVQRPPIASRSLGSAINAALRNVAGSLFIVLGLIMLVTPGPGVVSIVLGMSLCVFPGKHRLLRTLVGQPSVFAALNWLRQKSSKAPFLHP